MTPDSGWMNDPNGLVFFNGHYHQFCIANVVWGPIQGHKISTNLMIGKSLSLRCIPTTGMCFSAIYWHNTSGLFEAGKPNIGVLHVFHST